MQEIINKVKELCETANVPFLIPEFSLKGKIAGQFSYKGKQMGINYNSIFAENHREEFMSRTVPHEVAHYIRYYRNGCTHDRLSNGNRDIHGDKWKAVMTELGANDIKRCHSYDVSVIKGRKYKKFEYMCKCGIEHVLTSIKHNKIIRGINSYHCTNCNDTLQFIGEIK